MPLYKYEVLVELPDNQGARATMQDLHFAVCGGDTHVDEEGNVTHECRRWWSAQVAGWVPIPDEEPLEGAVEFIEDEGDLIVDDGPFEDAPENAGEVPE